MLNLTSIICTVYGMAALGYACLSGSLFRLPADLVQALSQIFTFSA